jgi:hypothetical protein
MKTIFAQQQDNGGNTRRGRVSIVCPQLLCDFANKSGTNLPHTGALVVHSFGAHWMHWLETFRRVCVGMQNRRLEPPALTQSNN